MGVEEFRALLTRMKRVIAILEEDGHPIEEQNARRDELRKLVGLLKNVK
jgi:hypothetical protein